MNSADSQRAIDDVLREQIGKSCYVYVDDVIIFSENETDHVNHIAWVLERLYEANMRVSRDKSHFFKESVEYLGFLYLVAESGLALIRYMQSETMNHHPRCLILDLF